VCVCVGMGQSSLHSKASLCLWKQRSKSVANSNSCYVLGGVCASVKVHTKVSMCLCVELCACTSCVGEVSLYQVYRCYLYLCSQLKCCEQNFLFWVGSQINCFLCMRSSLSIYLCLIYSRYYHGEDIHHRGLSLCGKMSTSMVEIFGF